MLGFQGARSIPLVKGGVEAPPAKCQCRAGPKAVARRGFTNTETELISCKGAFMASETFKKRQKEMARKEKKQKKAARRMERRDEKLRTESKIEGENPNPAEPSVTAAPHGPTIL